MADGIQVDNSNLSKLAADLGNAPAHAGKFARKAVEVAARNIRDDWRDTAKGMAHAPAFPYSVTYDIGTTAAQSASQALASVAAGGITAAAASTITAEIGPDKDRPQGALGNLIEYGSVNNPPQGLGHGALQRGEADFEKGVNLAIGDALKEIGL